MDSREARSRFTRLARLPDSHLDLLEGVLLIAVEDDPMLDFEHQLRRVRHLSAELEDHLAGAEDFLHAIWALRRTLFEDHGIRGDTEGLDDPDNYLLPRVLDRRAGSALLLCVLYREVARRLGFHVEVVGVPGAYVVAFEDDWGRTLVDPFAGGDVITSADLTASLVERFGPRARLLPEFLQALGPRSLLVRMLRQLKRLHARRGNDAAALRACERVVLLLPSAVSERRDRGLLYGRAGRRDEAIRDLRGYLASRPEAADALRIRRVLDGLLEQRSAEG